MAVTKRVIVLDAVNGDTVVAFRYVMWADVPAARQAFYANATKISAYKDISADDLAAIRTGAVAEELGTLKMDTGKTLAQARTDLQAMWTAFQDRITNANPWNRYGTYWDGTSWTAQGAT